MKVIEIEHVHRKENELSEHSLVNSGSNNTYPVAIDINWNKANTIHNKINTKAKRSVALGA